MILPAPGVGVTFYSGAPAANPEVLALCDFACIHAPAGRQVPALARDARAAGCSRLWLAVPGNYLVGLGHRSGVHALEAEGRRLARAALEIGAEVLEVNGEGRSDGAASRSDWSPEDPTETKELGTFAAAVLGAARDELRGHALLSWTSHDLPGFGLPWGAILGRVDLHSPQHCPAQKGRTVGQRELQARVRWSRLRWEPLVERGIVHADFQPWEARWSPYFQAHGHAPGALVWGLSCAPVVRLWACPGSWDAAVALEALRAARKLRSAVGYDFATLHESGKPVDDVGYHYGAVKRWQAQAGLVVDGIVGPLTMKSLST